jgi:hypothetical protein
MLLLLLLLRQDGKHPSIHHVVEPIYVSSDYPVYMCIFVTSAD